MERLLKWLAVPIHALMWIALLAGLLMMLHVTADVTGRTMFRSPIDGTTEFVSAIYMVAVAYLPWAWIAHRDGHIKVELFTGFLSPRSLAWLEVGVKLLTALYVSLFTWRTAARAIQQTELAEVWLAGTSYLPVWPSRWLLPIGGGLMVLYLVLRVLADIAALRREGAARA